jgi:hypothetical protein
MKCLAIAVSLALLLPGAVHAAEATAAVLETLHTQNPDVAWDGKGAVVADVTCDAVADVVVVGYQGKSVWIAMVPGAPAGKSGKPWLARFPISRNGQAGLCAMPVHLAVYPLNCDGDSDEAGEDEQPWLPGCRAIKGCSAFAVVDDTCDSLHFYWNSRRKALTWWRR